MPWGEEGLKLWDVVVRPPVEVEPPRNQLHTAIIAHSNRRSPEDGGGVVVGAAWRVAACRRLRAAVSICPRRLSWGALCADPGIDWPPGRDGRLSGRQHSDDAHPCQRSGDGAPALAAPPPGGTASSRPGRPGIWRACHHLAPGERSPLVGDDFTGQRSSDSAPSLGPWRSPGS